MPRIAIGTVQFGTQYGVSNTQGQTSFSELVDIVEFLSQAGSNLYDTAPLYGESEAVLGKCLANRTCRIVTKTNHFSGESITGQDAQSLIKTFGQSLSLLGKNSVYGLLIHQADDLLKPGSEWLIDALEQLKRDKQVQKVGVSVYNATQLDEVLLRFTPDLVQVPFNVLDQRLIASGHLQKLHRMGVEIHTRSAFLQGLLLMPAETRPPFFERFGLDLNRFDRFCEQQQLSALEVCLGFVMSVKPIDYVVVGGCNLVQWKEIVAASARRFDLALFESLATDDPALVEPSRWKL